MDFQNATTTPRDEYTFNSTINNGMSSKLIINFSQTRNKKHLEMIEPQTVGWTTTEVTMIEKEFREESNHSQQF